MTAVAAIPRWLEKQAAVLRPTGCAYTSVTGVCEELGVPIRVETVRNRPRVLGVLSRDDPGRFSIILFRRVPDAPLTPRERFTVAHELGHLLVHTKFRYEPKGKTEYWRLERWCDDFANRLLIGDLDVRAVLKAASPTSLGLLRAARELAERTGVSYPTAGHRLASEVDQSAFGVIEYNRRRGDRHVATVRWAREGEARILGLGTGKRLGPRHELAKILGVHEKSKIEAVAVTETAYGDVASARHGAFVRLAILGNVAREPAQLPRAEALGLEPKAPPPRSMKSASAPPAHGQLMLALA